MRGHLTGVLCLLSLAACGGIHIGGSTPSPRASVSPQASASASASATFTPTASVTPTAAVAEPSLAVTPPPGPAVLAPICPGGGPPSGEPPASDNGPTGACHAAQILYPAGGATCHPAGGSTYSATTNCPLYPQLAQRLDQHPLAGADGLCRCQNTYQAVTYTVAGPTQDGPTTYTVRVTLTFGAASQEALDVIVQQVQSGSLVSDIQCAGGGPSTSIMQAPSASNNYLHC